MRFILCISILLGTVTSSAHQPEDGHIYASFGTFTYQTATIDHQFDSPILLGPAIIGEADIGKKGGVEIGFQYLKNPFSVRYNNRTIVESLKRVYITTGWRQWFTPRFSMALAFASSYAIGDLRIVRDDYYKRPDRPRTSASDITEYGFDLSALYEPYQEGRWSLVVDGRYSHSVTAKRGEDSNHYGILIALKYFIQAREKIADDEE